MSYPIPSIISESPRGDRVMDVYSNLLAERIVYLGTAIDDGVANAVIAQLLHLESADPDRAVNLYINSPGGELPATFAIYDAMQYVLAPIATTVIGQAGANAALLLAAGSPGRRALLPHSRVLLHQPGARGQGPIPDLILAADEVIRQRGEAEEILARHTGQTVERLRADTDRDRIFTPQAAVDYGLADMVLPYRKQSAA
jgi:ATP-dependent Clp protease protease subunit